MKEEDFEIEDTPYEPDPITFKPGLNHLPIHGLNSSRIVPDNYIPPTEEEIRNSVTGRYFGNLEHLRGERAMIQPSPVSNKLLLVQFDNMSLENQGSRLAFGWHTFVMFVGEYSL